MIMKSEHPWGNFLHARKLAIEWMIKVLKYNNQQIVAALAMDPIQVELIHMTEVEDEPKT
jgi:hypothetical protein